MEKRIHSLDLIRGVALLGIYIINITLFAYDQDDLVAFFTQLEVEPTTNYQLFNVLLYLFVALLFNQKMMTLFSMLFGASIVLITDKIEQKGNNPAKIHYRRNFWLLLIGGIHLLVWYGDILFVYALAAFFLYPMRNRKPWEMVLLSLPLYLLNILVIGPVYTMSYLTGDYLLAIPIQLSDSVYNLLYMNLDFFKYFLLSMANMLVGMALYRTGVINNQRSSSLYKKVAWIAFPVAILAYIVENILLLEGIVVDMNTFAAVCMALGYISIITRWSRSSKFTGMQLRLQAVGRMALSNYLLQTIFSVFLFYNIFGGLRQYELDVFQQVLVVIAVWILQLSYSHRWLARFRYGPFEWLWRSLYYWNRQPLLR